MVAQVPGARRADERAGGTRDALSNATREAPMIPNTDPIQDDSPSFEDEETGEYNFDDPDDQETTWEWDGEAWKQLS
jgi:hypothetical protein